MDINWEEIITLIREGGEKTAAAIEQNSDDKKISGELRGSLSFLDQVQEWEGKVPPEKIHNSIISFIKKIETDLKEAVKAKILSPEVYGASEKNPTPVFIGETITAIGPDIIISTDKMKVHASVDAEFMDFWDAAKIKAGLERRGITAPISNVEIDKMLTEPGVVVKCAVGSKPVAGKDAIIEDCIGLDLDGIPSVINRNKVDLKSLNWIHNVAQDQTILSKKPATPGVPGSDVFGEEISCRDGVDIPFPSIANTSISEDGLNVLSMVDGCAYKVGDNIVVVPSLEIKDNVDYSTGHVNAEVTVNISGDVLTGFNVQTSKDIHVKGTVEASRLEAKGSIFLPGGVQGKSEAVIKSGKHIEAKFINAAQVLAKGEILVHGSIIQSKLRAWRIEALEKDADIIGGVIESEEDVCADTFGSEIGVKTVIKLGHDIPETTNKIAKLEEQLKQLDIKNQECSEKLTALERTKEENGVLSSTQEKVKAKLIENIAKLHETLDTKKRQIELFHEKLERSQGMQRMVRARKNMHPGVEVTILDHSFAPKAPTGPLTLIVTSEGIEQVPFEERTFESEEEVDE